MNLEIKKDGSSNIESIKFIDSKGVYCFYTGEVAKYIVSQIHKAIS